MTDPTTTPAPRILGWTVSSDKLGRTRTVMLKTPGDDAEERKVRRQVARLVDRWDREYGACCTTTRLILSE